MPRCSVSGCAKGWGHVSACPGRGGSPMIFPRSCGSGCQFRRNSRAVRTFAICSLLSFSLSIYLFLSMSIVSSLSCFDVPAPCVISYRFALYVSGAFIYFIVSNIISFIVLLFSLLLRYPFLEDITRLVLSNLSFSSYWLFFLFSYFVHNYNWNHIWLNITSSDCAHYICILIRLSSSLVFIMVYRGAEESSSVRIVFGLKWARMILFSARNWFVDPRLFSFGKANWWKILTKKMILQFSCAFY